MWPSWYFVTMVSSLDPSYPKRFTQVTFEVSGCHEHREDGAHTIVVVLLRGELLTTQPRHDLVELRSDLRPSFNSFQVQNKWWIDTSKSTLKHMFFEFGMRFSTENLHNSTHDVKQLVGGDNLLCQWSRVGITSRCWQLLGEVPPEMEDEIPNL